MTPIAANLALLLAAGWLFRRFGWLGDGAERAFNQYLFYLALPALIVLKIAGTPLDGLDWRFAAVNTLPPGAVMLAAWGLWRAGLADARLARVLIIVPALGNTAYFGFPVCALRLGEGSLGYAAVSSSLHNVFVFTFGLLLLSSVGDADRRPAPLRRLLGGNAVLWASLAGLLLAASGWRLPALPQKVLADVGATTLPLSLFTLGAGLYGRRLSHNLPRLALIGALKLLALPLACLLTARALGYGGEAARVGFLQACMPAAVMNYVVAKEFGFDEDLAGQSIVFTTLLFFPLLYLYDLALAALP